MLWSYTFDDETVLVEKDTAVAEPHATDIPHSLLQLSPESVPIRLWGAMSGPLRVVGQGDVTASVLLQVEGSSEVLVD